MIKLRNSIIKMYENNKKTIWLVFMSVFSFGFIAHGFAFSNIEFSNDSLNEFDASIYGHDIRIQFGRFLVPIYRILTRGVIAIQWIIGILALIYIALAVLLFVKMFNIKATGLVVLISGIFVTNMAVTSTTATYIHDLDCDMLALLLATLGAYLWQRYDKGFLLGIIPCVLSMGLYQSYISVTITLIIFYSILGLLNNKDSNAVMKKGLKGVGMISASGIVYAIIVKISLAVTHLQIISGHSSSLDNMFDKSIDRNLFGILKTYAMTPFKLFTIDSAFSNIAIIILNVMIIGISGVLMLCLMRHLKAKSIVLILVLLLVMPFGMNLAGVFTAGNTHDLMHFSIWLTYILAILIVWQFFKTKNIEFFNREVIVKSLSVLLVGIMLFGNVITSNSLYLKKKLEYDATLALMTRVVYSIENTPNYVVGETPVVLVGYPENEMRTIKGLNKYYHIMGIRHAYSISFSTDKRCSAYFKNVLLNPANIADEETFDKMNESEEVAKMPSYPYEGSVKFVDDVLVVKLGKQYIVR